MTVNGKIPSEQSYAAKGKGEKKSKKGKGKGKTEKMERTGSPAPRTEKRTLPPLLTPTSMVLDLGCTRAMTSRVAVQDLVKFCDQNNDCGIWYTRGS